jgi:hypothetical protein
MKDNVIFVDLIGQTAVGNPSNGPGSDIFSKSKFLLEYYV